MTDRLHLKAQELCATRERAVLLMARTRAWLGSMQRVLAQLDDARDAMVAEASDVYRVDGTAPPQRLTPAFARLLNLAPDSSRFRSDLRRANEHLDRAEVRIASDLQALFGRLRARARPSRVVPPRAVRSAKVILDFQIKYNLF